MTSPTTGPEHTAFVAIKPFTLDGEWLNFEQELEAAFILHFPPQPLDHGTSPTNEQD